MDSDQGKLFIGGISWETTEEKLKDYFEVYGAVMQTVIMRDKLTGKPRGFGFVVFADPSVLDRVLQDAHTIDGRTVRLRLDSGVLWVFYSFLFVGFCAFDVFFCWFNGSGLICHGTVRLCLDSTISWVFSRFLFWYV